MNAKPCSGIYLAAFCAAAGCTRGPTATPPAERPPPLLCAPRLEPDSIHIDGRLDEPAWQRAGATGAFVGPADGKPSSASQANATARLAWDESNLYVSMVVADRDAASPFSRVQIDPHVWERASGIEVMLQPGNPGDNRDYYELQIDVNGAIWDTHFDDYNAPIVQGPGGQRFGHQEWIARVQRAVVVDKATGRYSVEIAWPWSSLVRARTPVPPRPGDLWRINLYSFRDAQRDAMAWSPILGQGNFHRSSRWGRVRFAGAASDAPCTDAP
jgi:hypothetical protein